MGHCVSLSTRSEGRRTVSIWGQDRLRRCRTARLHRGYAGFSLLTTYVARAAVSHGDEVTLGKAFAGRRRL